MPSNFTANYNLSQWERTDQVRMEDFNSDNAKIDAAIKAEVNARTSAVNTLTGKIAKCGNCKIIYQIHTGDGTYGPDHPTTFTFPGKPLMVMIGIGGSVGVTYHGSKQFALLSGSSFQLCNIHWTDNSFYLAESAGPEYQLNQLNFKYTIITFLAAD